MLNGTLQKTITLKNIPLLGTTFDVNVTPGSAQLIHNSNVVLIAKNEIVRAPLKGDR